MAFPVDNFEMQLAYTHIYWKMWLYLYILLYYTHRLLYEGPQFLLLEYSLTHSLQTPLAVENYYIFIAVALVKLGGLIDVVSTACEVTEHPPPPYDTSSKFLPFITPLPLEKKNNLFRQVVQRNMTTTHIIALLHN